MGMQDFVSTPIVQPRNDFSAVAPISLTSQYTTIMLPGGINTQDAATLTDASTQILSPLKLTFPFPGVGLGTHLVVRLAYATTATPSTDPIVKLFGWTGSDAPEIIPNLSGVESVTLATAPSTDATFNGFRYTKISNSVIFDRRGCKNLLLGVETAFAVSAGSAATAFVLAKGM